MRIFMKTRSGRYDAQADYDLETKKTTVLKGSLLSSDIANSKSFRGGKKVMNLRAIYAKNNRLQQDVTFNSSSTAAVFVSGGSMNGLSVWKDESNTPLGELIKKTNID